MTELERIAKEATEHGMSYGEYVSWKSQTSIADKQNFRRARQLAKINKKRGKKRAEV